MGSKYRWLAAVLWVAILTLPGISRGASTNVFSVADATVCSGWSDLNFGGYEDIAVGYSFRGEVFPLYKKAILMRSLVRFDLQGRLPGGVYASNIIEGRIRLSLREVNSSRIFDAPLSVWLVTNSWSEAQVTWNSRPHGESVEVTHSWRTNMVPQQIEIVLPAAVVRNWWSNPAANQGVELSCPWAETNNFFASFAGREAGASGPVLEISYTEPGRYTIAGQVTSPNWPYGGLAGITISTDSGETTTTSSNGAFVLSEVPWGQHRITAHRVDYEAPAGLPETWQEMFVTENLEGILFTNLSCKARPEVRVNIATNVVAPGETINVELTLENVGAEVGSVGAQVELSFDPGLVSVGTVTTNTWPGTIAHYLPGTRYPTDYGVIAQTEQQGFGSNQSFSFSVPLTVLHTLSTGEIALKFRGVIEDRLAPPDATGNYLDQAGWPVWASNITVVKPMQLLGQSISTTNVRDGQTITVGYQVYSPRKISCALGCILERPGAPGVIRDETQEGAGTPEVQITEGTNWYYRDFFLNLGPADTPGTYDVVWSVQGNGLPAIAALGTRGNPHRASRANPDSHPDVSQGRTYSLLVLLDYDRCAPRAVAGAQGVRL